MTERCSASASVSAGSQLSRLPRKCWSITSGVALGAPKRRYAKRTPAASTNCVSAVRCVAGWGSVADMVGSSFGWDVPHPPSRQGRPVAPGETPGPFGHRPATSGRYDAVHLLHVPVGGRVCLRGRAPLLPCVEVGGVPVPPVVRL